MVTSSPVIDTDTNVSPHLEDLKARGVTHIGRYYSSKAWKRLTKTEAQAIAQAGLSLFTVFEDSGSPALTIDRGRHDAQIAFSQARAVGQPEGSCIYFAMENLPNGYGEADIPGLKLYFEGVRRTLRDCYKVGVYSNGASLAALLEAKLCDFPWLSASLSFTGSRDFAANGPWVLQQRHIDLNWGGVSVDTNEARGEFGAFSLPTPTVVAQEASAAADEAPSSPTHVEDARDPDPAPEVTPPARSASDKPGDVTWVRMRGPSLWQRWSTWLGKMTVSRIDDLADQGSRLAQHFRAWKAAVFRSGATVATGGAAAATLVDPSKGTGHAVLSLVSAPVLIAVAATVVVMLLVLWLVLKRGEKWLLTASTAGRYVPRADVPLPQTAAPPPPPRPAPPAPLAQAPAGETNLNLQGGAKFALAPMPMSPTGTAIMPAPAPTPAPTPAGRDDVKDL